jgi:putative acetyltransferase
MTITIRHAEPGDYIALHQIFSGPKAFEGTLQMPFQSTEAMRKRYAETPTGYYPLVACDGSEIVGTATLIVVATARRRHVGEIGMAVRDDWQGRGVGSALMQAMLDIADNWLNLRRIELQVYADNAAGIALYTKFGFITEGTLRQYAFRNGHYVDALFMARLHIR